MYIEFESFDPLYHVLNHYVTRNNRNVWYIKTNLDFAFNSKPKFIQWFSLQRTKDDHYDHLMMVLKCYLNYYCKIIAVKLSIHELEITVVAVYVKQ